MEAWDGSATGVTTARMYSKMYHILFNAITDALDPGRRDEEARQILMGAQQEAEEIYLSWQEDPEADP